MDSVALARSLGVAATMRLQRGLIRRDQALALGFSSASISSEVRAGRWRRVLPRVYAVEIGPLPPALRVRATRLWAGDDSTIVGSAAAWWVRLHTAFPALVDVVVPPGKRMSGQPGVRVIRARLDGLDRVSRDGICVTAVPRTCLDLVRAGRDEILEDALRRRRIRLDELPGSLARSWHRRGQVRARRAVEDVSATPWSRPERRAHQLLRDAGVSGQLHQVSGRPRDPRRSSH